MLIYVLILAISLWGLEQIRPSWCHSFLVCISYGCIFPCFYQPPLSLLSISVSVPVSLSMFVSVRLSFMCFFPSLLLPVLLLSIFLSLSLTLAVSTFGENSTGAPLGKVLPLSSSLPSTTGSNWLLALSFFLVMIVHTHSPQTVLFCTSTNKNIHTRLKQVQIINFYFFNYSMIKCRHKRNMTVQENPLSFVDINKSAAGVHITLRIMEKNTKYLLLFPLYSISKTTCWALIIVAERVLL